MSLTRFARLKDSAYWPRFLLLISFFIVIPAKAGIQSNAIPAFLGGTIMLKKSP